MHPLPVADLGWLRLGSFRLLFAGLFDPPVGGAPLAQGHPPGGSPPAGRGGQRAVARGLAGADARAGGRCARRRPRTVGCASTSTGPTAAASRRSSSRAPAPAIRAPCWPSSSRRRARRVRRQPRGDRSGAPPAADRARRGGQAGRLLGRRASAWRRSARAAAIRSSRAASNTPGASGRSSRSARQPAIGAAAQAQRTRTT